MPKKVQKSKSNTLIGKRFRSVIGDCNALWEVKSSRGRGAYICLVVNEIDDEYGSDFAGTRRVFGQEEIEVAIRWDEFQDESLRRHKDFYGSLALGQIVHYHDGFGQYVRCEVVIADNPRKNIDRHVSAGEKCLKEIALVGNWREEDLWLDGYHMQGIRQARLFKPNASNLWENPEFDRREGTLPDPIGLEALPVCGQQELFA